MYFVKLLTVTPAALVICKAASVPTIHLFIAGHAADQADK